MLTHGINEGFAAIGRRIRRPLLAVAVPPILFVLGVAGSRRLDSWSVAAGAAAAIAIAFVIFARDDPPQHVVNWNAARTASDAPKTHFARSRDKVGWSNTTSSESHGGISTTSLPDRVASFLWETKNLAGTIAFENGMLTASQFDDPDEVYRYVALAGRVRAQAADVSNRLRQETGRGAWVTAAIVIWGHFPAGLIEHDHVTYIAGGRLAACLTSPAGVPHALLPVRSPQ